MSNLTWDQGEDLEIKMIYKEGASEETLVTIDLSSNYSLRMDILVPATKERIYTFNSADIPDVDPITGGAQPDTIHEATLTSGAGGTPNINIVVPRTLTLPGGVIYDKLTANPPVTLFNSDVFLRNTSSNRQSKIWSGTITVVESYTLWL